MHSESRRNFVKKSLATSVTISFAGLIRAHGQEGGGTTWNPNQTTYSSTNGGGTTTWNPNQNTTSPNGSTTWAPGETTVETTFSETTVSDSKKRKWKCKLTIRGPRSAPYSQSELDQIDFDWGTSNPGYWGSSPTGPPQGSRYISGPENLEFWDPSRPEVMQTARWRENGPVMSNWQDPSTNEYYAVYLYDYIELEYELESPTEP